MKTIEAIKTLEKMQKPVFNVNDMAKIMQKSKNYSSLFLHRLKRKGLILEIEKNKYIINKESPYLIFSNIIYPSYLSFLTAFSYYNLKHKYQKKYKL